MSDALARIFEAAAEARSASVRESADRPSQRRCAEEPNAAPLVRAQASGVQVRAASEGDGAHFSGFASVYNRGYEMWDMFGPYTEQVSTGAGCGVAGPRRPRRAARARPRQPATHRPHDERHPDPL
jgi:hypothetical protein